MCTKKTKPNRSAKIMSFISRLFKSHTQEGTLIKDPNGPHTLGGKPSAQLTLPKLDGSPVVYFGTLNRDVPLLDSLDFDLALVCPLFIDLQVPVFLDYSDPNRPQIIQDNVSTNFAPLFDDIPASTYVEYQEIGFKLDRKKPHRMDQVYPGEVGHFGTPNWIHEDLTPTCPISGKPMEFLLQLGDIDDAKTIHGQEVLDKEYIDPYLHFGHGYLYVFFQADTKVIAYLNQL
ncbi:hypothetical protein KFE98_14715 [bacterium SCSIO 12741]|nr:hypothetical protein KFE98_14715 [bacterium SCSIO 12741]